MHIPDGFIDGKTAATTALLSAAGVGLALRQVRRLASELVTTGPIEERIEVVRDVCALLRRQGFAYPQTAHSVIEQIGCDAMATGDGALA